MKQKRFYKVQCTKCGKRWHHKHEAPAPCPVCGCDTAKYKGRITAVNWTYVQRKADS